MRLAIRARSGGLAAADVDQALTDERSLVLTWLCRFTLHLICSEDYHWLHALTTPPLRRANERRLAQEGVTPRAAERGVAVIERSLAEDGPLTRSALGELLAAAGVRTEGQALVHLLALASLRGLIVRGPMVGRQHAYVLVRDWLPPGTPIERDRALAGLARRYLAGHGPADERDLAKWAGLPLRDARAGFGAIASHLERRADGLFDLRRRPPAGELPPPRLLGPYDPVLLGWCSCEWILGAHQGVVAVNGLIRGIALIGGRAVATWKLNDGEVVLDAFDRGAGENSAALQADARDVLSYLGLE